MNTKINTTNNNKSMIVKLLIAVIVIVFASLPFIDFSSDEDYVDVVASPKSKAKIEKYRNENLPDFSKFKDVKEKKSAFFGYLKPLVEDINEEIRDQRAFIKSLDAVPTNKDAKTRYDRLVKRYDIEAELDFASAKAKLLKRADTLPVSLVLMQAANESAWGTSRFALEANNLFGQWCFTKGCGIVPTGRPDGESYEVRKFKHPIASIRSYFNNLNTGHAYVDLRDIRKERRLAGHKTLDATDLANGLIKYSIRREAYVEEIQSMIRINSKYVK